MRTALKLPLLKLIILGVALLTAFPLAAQRKALSPGQVAQAEKELLSQPANKAKVGTLLDVSNWYYDVHTPDIQDFSKASNFALQALAASKAINYQKGIGESYLLLSKINQEAKNYVKGGAYATNAVNALKQVNEPDLLGESWVMLWSNNSLTGTDYRRRVSLLKNAAEAFNLSGNMVREGDCLKELGDIYQIEGNYAQALTVLNKAMALYNKAHYKKLYFIYDLTGRVYLLMGDLDKGVEYILLAEEVFDELDDAGIFTSTLNNSIAMAYAKSGQPDEALPYIQKALRIAIQFNDFNKIAVILINNVNILISLKRTGEAIALINTITAKYPGLKDQKDPMVESMMVDAYIARKEFGKAAYYSTGIEKKIKRYGPKLNKDYIFNYIGSVIQYNIAAGHYDKASCYNAKYDSLCNIRERMFCNAYNLWEFKIDSAAGNYVAAIKHFQRFKQVNDEMFSQAKTTQINQLSILHESEKKDKNIQLLQQQAASQLSRLESANFIRNTTLFGLLFMSVCIFIMYKSYRLKQKTNKVLKEQKEMIDAKNESLQHLVNEKEWLLKEIHHRVKNNLHMVVGLLASQIEYLKGDEAVQAINESQRRVEAMAMIHQKLYQSDNLSMIDMPSYIVELTEYLADSFNKIKSIHFVLDIEKVEFPLSHSIPLGLILNEAITNAIKYAFPDGKDGVIKIFLKSAGTSAYKLIIWDNGIGLPLNFDMVACSSLGLKLIKGLSDDLQGRFAIANNNGTKILLAFTIDDYRHDMKIK